jgi:hypothetical protein
MRIKSTILILAAVLTSATTALAQQQYLAGFMPNSNYQILVKKTHGGNDGFKDVIPQLSAQSILVETGEVTATALPVTMTVYRAQRIETAKSSDAPMLDWKFTFTVAAGGEITLVDAQSSDGRLPDDIVRRILAAQLDVVLFQSGSPLDAANRPNITILSATPASDGTVNIGYDVTQKGPERELSAGERGTVTTITGSATYDPALKFYTKRAHTEQSKMYINDDPTGEGKIVVMKTVTTVDAVVSVRK